VQTKVVEWLRRETNCFIDTEVDISPGGKLKSQKNLGDSDVFAIDHKKSIIYSIECKRTEQAKNGKQMVEQVDQYFGRNSKMGYFSKHLRRHSWLELNLKKIGEAYSFDASGYLILSFFVTYEILAIQFMEAKPTPIPIISLFELKGMNYDEFINKINT